jgi:hypothetical protein
MAIKDLLTGTDNKTLSSSQLWFHIVYGGIMICYMAIGFNVTRHIFNSPQTASGLLDSFGWFTLIVAGIVTSNKFANKLIELKIGKQNDTTTPT